MGMNVSNFFPLRLGQWNIRRIHDSPGDGINGIPGAMDRADDRPALGRTRQVEMRTFTASAQEKIGENS